MVLVALQKPPHLGPHPEEHIRTKKVQLTMYVDNVLMIIKLIIRNNLSTNCVFKYQSF